MKNLVAVVLALVGAGGLGAQDSEPLPEESTYKMSGTAGWETNLINDGLLSLNAPTFPTSPTPAWATVVDFDHQFSRPQVQFSARERISVDNANSWSVTVFEAYSLWKPVDSLNLVLGKKRLSLGVGQTFTFADALNQPFQQSYFTINPGFVGFQLLWSPTDDLSVNGAFDVDDALSAGVADPAKFRYAVVANGLWDKLQVQLSGVYEWSKTAVAGLGLTYDWGGIVFSAEGAAEFLPQSRLPGTLPSIAEWTDPRWSGSAGLRYQYVGDDLSATVSAEYDYWGQGLSQADTDGLSPAALGNLTARLYTTQQPITLRNQHYAVGKLILGWEDYFSLSQAVFWNVVDQSVLVQHGLSLTFWETAELDAALSWANGPNRSEWQALPLLTGKHTSLFLAVKYHF